MIGTPVEATLWRVAFRYRKHTEPVPPARPELAGLRAEIAAASALPFITEERFVLTADPAGADLYETAVRAIFGTDTPPEFAIMGAQRVSDAVKGLALVSSSTA